MKQPTIFLSVDSEQKQNINSNQKLKKSDYLKILNPEIVCFSLCRNFDVIFKQKLVHDDNIRLSAVGE